MKSQVAYSYIRFSKGLQAKGDSFRRQLDNTRDYCRRRGLQLDESLHFRDLGVSGWTGRNLNSGALGAFIDACKRGIVKPGSALVIESLDRLSRQKPRKVLSVMHSLLDDYEIDIHVTSADKVFLSQSENEGMDLFYAVALATRANDESETKSKRLLEAWEQKRKNAREKKLLLRTELPWWLVLQRGKIVSPPARRATVVEIFKLTKAGYSSAQIARMLNAKKRPTWRPQKLWGSARVRGLVRSKAPQGFLSATQKTRVAGRHYEMPGYYPVLIDEKLAASARATLDNNTRGNRGRPSKNRRPTNIFRGLLRHNGRWTSHATHQNGRRDPETASRGWNSYYECFDELGGKTKGKLLFFISGKQLEPVVFAGLSELKAEDLAPPEPESVSARLAHLSDQLKGLEKSRVNLLRSIESGSASVATRLVQVERELDDLKAERDKVRLRREPITLEQGTFKEIAANLTDPEIRARAAVALRRIVKRIDIARSFEGLPINDDLRRRYLLQRDTVLAEARVFKDPVPNTRRRKPLHVLVTFSSGIARYIGRIEGAKDQLVSWRVEPSAEAH